MARVTISVESPTEGVYTITLEAERALNEYPQDPIKRALDNAVEKVRKAYGIDN